MLIRLYNRKGTIPRLSPRLLPPEYAQVAENCKLWQKEIRPVGGLLKITELFHGLNTQTVYRYNAGSGAGYWFNWRDVVHAAKGAVANDTIRRLYYTGARDDYEGVVVAGNKPKKTSNVLAPGVEGVELPAAWYWMGVQAPLEKPYVSATGGAATQVATYYVVTYVTAWGEESAPSPPSAELLRRDDDTVTVRKGPATNSTTAKTVTFDITNNEVEATAHNFADYSAVMFTGDPDDALNTSSTFYVIPVSANAFKVALSLEDALLGRAIDLTGGASGTVTCLQTGLDPRYNITHWRVYRTITGSEATDFALVNVSADIAIATQSYSDTTTDENLGEALAAYDYNEPPEDLEGVTEHPGGFSVGFSNTEHKVCMSAPFFPHAWPDTADYRKTVSGTIVAVKVLGTAVMVLKDGEKPEILDGPVPETMTPNTLDARQSCLEARSAVDTPSGVLFSSPDGPYRILPGSGDLPWLELYSKDEWAETRPETHRAEVYDGRLFISHDADGFGNRKLIILDPNAPEAGVITSDLDVDAMYADIATDGLYLVIEGALYQWDVDDTNPLTYTYRSPKIALPSKMNLSAAQLKGDYTLSGIIGGTLSFAEYAALQADAIVWNEATRDNEGSGPFHFPSAFGGLPFGALAFAMEDVVGGLPEIGEGVIFRLFVNGVLKHTATITDEKPFRLPSGYRGDEAEIEVEGQITLQEILVGTSMASLKGG